MTPMAQDAESTEENQTKNPATAANNDRQEDGQDSAPGICFMRAGQTDATQDDVPDADNHAATKRNDQQRRN